MTVRDFKTGAWYSREAADRYHANTLAGSEVFKALRHTQYIDKIRQYAGPGARILDLGCGSGLVSIALHDLGFKVVACDVSPGMLAKHAEERGVREYELRQGNGYAIPAGDGEFDMVVSRMFIAHFPDWPKILREKARVTRPDGIVLFDFGNREHVDACDPQLGCTDDFPYCANEKYEGKFYAVADEQEMRDEAAKCGLEVVQIVPHGLLLNNGFVWKAFGRAGVDELNKHLDAVLANIAARQLLFLLEGAIVPLLPKTACYGNLTVLRRTPEAIPQS
jgi:ubiquinone/menaquinone biosynthesis C-methylase UbiE